MTGRRAVAAVVALGATPAAAEPVATVRAPAAEVIERGAATPLVHDVPDGAASVRASAGWDTAAAHPLAGVDLELRVWGRIHAVGGAMWAARGVDGLRPYGGVAVTLARPGAGRTGAAVSLVYRPEGLTEPEGELELTFAASRRVGGLTLVGALTYGQDPEARERDAEQAVALQGRVGERLWLGVAERARVALASPAAGEPSWDLAAGPHAAFDAGPVILTGFAGGVGRAVDGDTAVGLSATLGVARAF